LGSLWPVARLVGLTSYDGSAREQAASSGLLEVRDGGEGRLKLPRTCGRGDAVGAVLSDREGD
jgi:hypothetical protein